MPSWVCQWKPFWIPVGELFKKAFLEEWVFVGGDSSDEQHVTEFPVLHSTDHTDYLRDDHPPAPRPSRQPDSLPWEPTRPRCPSIFMLLRAGGYQLVHGPGSKRSWSTAVTSMVQPWSVSGLSLCVSPASLSDVFSLRLHVESSPENRHSSKYTLCQVSPVERQNTCSLSLCGAFPTSGSHMCWCGTIATTFRNVLDEIVKTIALVPRVNNFSIETTIACCRFRFARATFTTADGKVSEFARCCPLEPSRCFAMMFMVSRKFFSPSCHFGIVSCSRVFLLVGSRLLGQTLRPFAPVCTCHRDSLTLARWFLDAYVKCLFMRCWYMKVLQPSSNCFSHFPLFLVSAQFSTLYSGYAWARSKCATSWCVECTLQDSWRTNPTNILNTESLCHVCFTHLRVSFLAIASSCESLICFLVD